MEINDKQKTEENTQTAEGDSVQAVVMQWKLRAEQCDSDIERSDDIETSYSISLKQRTMMEQASITLRNCADELASILA